MPGSIEPKTLRTEQYELEARTTDPANTEPGEYWIRTDQTSSNPQVVAELRRQDTNGVSKIPLFADSEEANLGSQVVRGPSVVLDDGSVGFVAMAADSGAKFGSPRVVTAAGTEYLSHDSLTLSNIPDSAITSFESSNWANNFDGETAQFTRETANPYDGSYNITSDAQGYDSFAFSSSKLSQSGGYTFELWMDITDNGAGDIGGPMFINSSNDGYIIYITSSGGDMYLNEHTGFGQNLGSQFGTFTQSTNIPSSGWFRVEVQVAGSDVTVTTFDNNGNTLDSATTVSDSTYTGCNFIGVHNYAQNVDYDLLQATSV